MARQSAVRVDRPAIEPSGDGGQRLLVDVPDHPPRGRRSSGTRPPTPNDRMRVMRAAVRAGAANRPGIYRMLSADGEVVYVGKSKRLRSRLLSYSGARIRRTRARGSSGRPSRSTGSTRRVSSRHSSASCG